MRPLRVIFLLVACAVGVLVLSLRLGLRSHLAALRRAASAGSSDVARGSLADARRGFVSKIVRAESDPEPPAPPPAQLFRMVKYKSAAGELWAYLSTAPEGRERHPAIIWLMGGFSNGIGDAAWQPGERDNDQSASAFREAGVIMMYPALRGGSGNPGTFERFYGEVDDVLAAADFLAKQSYVDPKRIYLGGHSTGGTLALLAAELAPHDRFRAVFSFGPVGSVTAYGREEMTFDTTSRGEVELRTPILWLADIATPTFVFEGVKPQSNVAELRRMAAASKNPQLHFHAVPTIDHFSILQPVTRLVARKIVRDA